MASRARPNVDVMDDAGMARLISQSSPALLLQRARETPTATAFRDKHLGIYVGYDWREYARQVEETALGLLDLGVQRGERVAIMGDPCPEWVVADMAVMGIAAITVGIYPTSSSNEVEYIVKDAGTSMFIAETQEHLDKLLSSAADVSNLRKIVVIDTRALFNFRHDRVISFKDLRELGRARRTRKPDEFAQCVASVAADDPAAIVYTSGTTGPPKGAVLSHRSLIAGAVSYINCNPDIREREHRSVAHLPLSHVVARVLVVTTPLLTKLVPFFCEEIDEFGETMREVAPNFLVLPPRFYEKFAAQLLVGIETSTPSKHWSYKLAQTVGRRVLGRRRIGQRVGAVDSIAYWLARQLVFRQLLEKIGLAKCRIAFTGSAPMPPQIVEIWQTWGLDLREIYGVTECCGISIAQYHAFPAPEDIGVPATLPQFEFRLSEEGEILLRSPMVFSAYWRRPEATSEVRDPDGWYHTGDVAEITPQNRIKLVDRLRDVIVTSGGKTLSPQQIEKVVKGSPFISEAVVFGDGRRYVTALLELDYTTVSEWARTYKIPYTSYASLVTHPEVVQLIEKEVARANEFLARVEQVKAFRVIPVELDPEQGETTPTRKIKRGLMYEMFGALVEDMYQSSGERVLAANPNQVAVAR
jgi:long-chain acyl-CoA synthetase